jgi:hypothetical protein
MQIKNLGNVSLDQLSYEVDQGGRFVLYQYCISALVITFKRRSDIYYIPPGQSRYTKGFGFAALSLLFGWWGLPWGPIYTVSTLATNFKGGKDVTMEAMYMLRHQDDKMIDYDNPDAN